MTKEEAYGLHFLGTGLELQLLCGAILLGIVLGAVYDIIRALRLTLKHSAIIVFAEDAVFTVAFGLCFYTYCTALCRGELRGFVLVGMLIGFGAYLLTLGRLVVKVVTKITENVKKLLTALGKMLKKALVILLGTPYFKKKNKKVEENPCQNEDFDV